MAFAARWIEESLGAELRAVHGRGPRYFSRFRTDVTTLDNGDLFLPPGDQPSILGQFHLGRFEAIGNVGQLGVNIGLLHFDHSKFCLGGVQGLGGLLKPVSTTFRRRFESRHFRSTRTDAIAELSRFAHRFEILLPQCLDLAAEPFEVRRRFGSGRVEFVEPSASFVSRRGRVVRLLVGIADLKL